MGNRSERVGACLATLEHPRKAEIQQLRQAAVVDLVRRWVRA